MKNVVISALIWAVWLSGSSCFGRDEGAVNPLSHPLQGKACQIFEEPGVSHAKADSELAAFACLGFLHGRDRAWQMDFLRRIVQGRRAELLGYGSLRDDLQMRMLRLDRKAEQLFARMTEEQRAPLWAYAYGVNQGFQTDRAVNSYEFKHYGYLPDEWRPVHTLEVLLLQSFDQTRDTFEKKLDEASWLEHHGAQAPVLFARDGFPWSTTILKEGEYPVSSRVSSAEAGLEILPRPEVPSFPTGETGKGSNNWAIAPQRSLTKNAFFANDPHLELKHPPFWYWAHIEGGKMDVIGASLPGTPMIASGTNRHVSWGLTNSYFDVSELAYVPNEDLKNGNSKTFWPLVWVRIGSLKLPFFFKSFQRTAQDWPVLPLSVGPADHALVLRWSGYETEPSDIVGMFEIMKATSAKEADLALSHVGFPSWNFTFADTEGAIGYRTVGQLPKREQPLPYGVPKRRLAEWAPWTYLSADEAPHVLQPARGYIVTANNQQWPGNALFRDGRYHASSFRAFRIEELLKQTAKHDRETLRKIQCDQQAVDARFLLSGLLRTLELAASTHGGFSAREAQVVEAFKQWDFNAGESCRVCGVWNRWLDHLFDEENVNREALYRLASASPPSEAFSNSVLRTFQGALDDLSIGTDGQLKKWGEIHVNPFSHFSGDRAFAVMPISTGGVVHSVNPGTSKWDPSLREYIHTAGASQRLIVEMSSPPVVHVILAGSNRDVESPNLSDPEGPWMKWKGCELEQRRFPLDWQQVQGESVILR